ncbi:MAG: inositol monophosphatase [Prevotellaceae bacterium]|jgi:myo-inositol-1(or 4)-monophosphatase|nr:inositol monophosphatase [Prevotellaceae bacterium]
MNLSQLTPAVCRIATETGGYLKAERKNFRREAVVEKHAHDYVSYVDRQAEKRIVEALSPLLPQAGFITEEETVRYAGQPLYWVIDPLDGTTNYIHDNPSYCVSIALCSHTELLLGVVYEPCRDECFYGWKGGGAYLNGQPLRVSTLADMQQALLVTELPYNYQQYARTAEHLLHALYGRVGALRMNGSAALALCYVAAGRFDGWMEAFIGRWDYSAAALLVQEAGGRVTDFRGRDDFGAGHHIVASNGLLHESLLHVLAGAMPEGI